MASAKFIDLSSIDLIFFFAFLLIFHSLSACSSVSCLNVHLSVLSLETISRSAHILILSDLPVSQGYNFSFDICLFVYSSLVYHSFLAQIIPPFSHLLPLHFSLCYPACFCDQCRILARLLDQAFSHIGHPSSGEHYELVSILHHICSESQEDTQVLYL